MLNLSQFPQGGQQQSEHHKYRNPPHERGGGFLPFRSQFPQGGQRNRIRYGAMSPKKDYIGNMNNTTTPPKGTRGTFSHPDLPRMGKMTGTIGEDKVFLPDEKYHHKLFDLYSVEALEGLLLDGGSFLPIEE